MKPTDVKSGTYLEFEFESNDKDLKSEVYDPIKIWKYKNVLAKAFISNLSEEVFVTKKS